MVYVRDDRVDGILSKFFLVGWWKKKLDGQQEEDSVFDKPLEPKLEIKITKTNYCAPTQT
jgi:hypothetical protein